MGATFRLLLSSTNHSQKLIKQSLWNETHDTTAKKGVGMICIEPQRGDMTEHKYRRFYSFCKYNSNNLQRKTMWQTTAAASSKLQTQRPMAAIMRKIPSRQISLVGPCTIHVRVPCTISGVKPRTHLFLCLLQHNHKSFTTSCFDDMT